MRRELTSTWRRVAHSTARYEGSYDLSFDELSDGQKALIALYTLHHEAQGVGRLLCVDEPENFLAIREVQPLIMALSEAGDRQLLLISHSAEVLNLLAPQAGILLSGTPAGTVTTQRFGSTVSNILSPAEILARGWEDELG